MVKNTTNNAVRDYNKLLHILKDQGIKVKTRSVYKLIAGEKPIEEDQSVWGWMEHGIIHISKECPKEHLFHTLLHELGHWYQYKLGKELNEHNADEFALALAGTPAPGFIS